MPLCRASRCCLYLAEADKSRTSPFVALFALPGFILYSVVSSENYTRLIGELAIAKACVILIRQSNGEKERIGQEYDGGD
jgi:hypothetical protein